MKRFLVFYGDSYFPDRGMDNFAGDFQTKDEAFAEIRNRIKSSKRAGLDSQFEFEWAQVYDFETKEISNISLNSSF